MDICNYLNSKLILTVESDESTATTNAGGNDQCSSSLNSSRSQYTQREKQDTTQQAPINSHLMETLWKIGEGADRQSNSGISTTEEHLELKTNGNQHQGPDFQYKCQDNSTVWGENRDRHEKNEQKLDSTRKEGPEQSCSSGSNGSSSSSSVGAFKRSFILVNSICNT
ncbi:unnamed protein product [Schistosoma curassoni]|uniref:Uncharacterized protein n=1 Tax=Schistosoma curassoni TaxID=6186 RepID=A0A183JH37_9TREM|nr:unnamed protein product [Schistosoma curassoni]